MIILTYTLENSLFFRREKDTQIIKKIIIQPKKPLTVYFINIM